MILYAGKFLLDLDRAGTFSRCCGGLINQHCAITGDGATSDRRRGGFV